MLSNRRLPIVAAVLLLFAAVAVLLTHTNRSADRSFRQFAVEIDTARVTAVTIEWPGNDTVLNLNRRASGWVVTVPTGDMAANAQQVDELLSCLSAVEAVRQMTNSRSVWPRYGVAADSSTHITVRSQKRILADFYCGRAEVDAQKGRIWTFVRNTDEPAVYMTDGYLHFALNRPFSSWVMRF